MWATFQQARHFYLGAHLLSVAALADASGIEHGLRDCESTILTTSLSDTLHWFILWSAVILRDRFVLSFCQCRSADWTVPQREQSDENTHGSTGNGWDDITFHVLSFDIIASSGVSFLSSVDGWPCSQDTNQMTWLASVSSHVILPILGLFCSLC